MKRAQAANAGFTLVEALVAVALMGLIVGALATVTAQWLPSWNRGLVRVQHNEQAAIALERLSADLSAALYVTPNRETRRPLFEGEELGVIFVRTAIGPNTNPGLEIVRIAETADASGRMLVRMRAPFAPLPIGDLSYQHIAFADPVVLLRPPLRVTFSYPADRGAWQSSWRMGEGMFNVSGQLPNILPGAIRFTVRDAVAERVLAVSSATLIHAETPAPTPQQSAPGPDQAAQPEAAGMPGRRG
jgi:general secretion pathway protein J